MTKGEVGVWNGPKKDDVIYEQPLMTTLNPAIIDLLTNLYSTNLLRDDYNFFAQSSPGIS